MEKLKNFPIIFYAMIMGFCGLAVSYHQLSGILLLPTFIFNILKYFVIGLFILISIFYILKVILCFDKVKAEFNHPIKLNFFAAISIAMMLVAAIWKDNSIIYPYFFWIGLILQTILTLAVISAWINRHLLIGQLSPAWFIPIVGNLIVPIAYQENEQFLWYYFSIGLFFWIVLSSLVFYRLFFTEEFPKKFMPTLFIFIAPSSIAFLDYIKLSGFDNFAMILINITTFFILLLIFMFKHFLNMKFFLSWWAFTFPSAAGSLSLIKMYSITNQDFYLYLSLFCFIALIFFILLSSFYTIKNIFNGSVFVED